MNSIRYPRPVADDIECACKRCPDRLPSVQVEQTEDGEIHKFVFTEEDITPPDFSQMDARDLTLQAQIDAGVELKETKPIMPHAMDAVSAVMAQAAKGLNDVSSYNKPKFD